MLSVLLFHSPPSRGNIYCVAILPQEDNRILRAREAQEKKRQKQQIDRLATQVNVRNSLAGPYIRERTVEVTIV